MGIYPLQGENEQPAGNRFFRRMRWGAIAFAIATVVLRFVACPLLMITGCSRGNADAAVFVAMLIELALIVMLFVDRRTWRFTAGFFCAFLVAATFTRGRATIFWIAPPSRAIDAARPLWGPAVERQEASAAKNEWIGIKRTQRPTIVHAVRLVNLVHECAHQAMVADSINSFPRSAADVSTPPGCEMLRGLELHAESAPSRYTETDNGWRWRYVGGAPDAYGRVMTYAIRVSEDPVIDRPASPLFTSDEKGAVVEHAAGAAPMPVASPVASLLTLRKCLLRVPAANEALRASSQWLGRSSAMNSVSSVCPELAHHITTDYPGHDDNRGRLAVPAREQAGEFTDTAAVYVTQFIPADVDGTIFELLAWPARVRNPAIRAGIRQFFVARDGSIHARTGAEPPTIADPIAAECLPGGGVDCGVAEAPAPVPSP
jgi:hypothetical protein